MALAGAYDGLAARWDADAGRVYRPLGRALVAASPIPLNAQLVVDVGSGTGAVAEAAAARGARVVVADRSTGMVAHPAGRTWPAVAADARALPFRPATFDGALAGFVVNHLHPGPALAEMARVVRPGGAVLASTWAAGADPVKAAVDAVVVSWGWVPPAWYVAMKTEVLPISGVASALAAAAHQSGLGDVQASVCHPHLGLRDPRAVVAYRLAVPHIAPWLATLDRRARVELTRQAVRAVTLPREGWRPAVIILTARVAGQSSRGAAARSSADA
ncbi:MAG TPA: class I SAM-dependent methyltransferase [Acidimicrobiales bacterium]|jgi:ubiquinone/menaquinone biosynthesis C-methylase UbiE